MSNKLKGFLLCSFIFIILLGVFSKNTTKEFNPEYCEKASIMYMNLNEKNVEEFESYLTKDFDYNSVVFNSDSKFNITSSSEFFIIDFETSSTYTIVQHSTDYMTRTYLVKCYFNSEGIYRIEHSETNTNNIRELFINDY